MFANSHKESEMDESLRGQLILSLFPGADLLGRAFVALGACVVQAGDIMQGHDIREFHALPGRFDGIIGGPPCQIFSKLTALNGTLAENMIPDFLRVVEEARPRWAVMENVPTARKHGPEWDRVLLSDWDCGGLTQRKRLFWFYGMTAPDQPSRREGKGAWAVMASSWKGRTGKKNGGTKGVHRILQPQEAARLQGYPGLEAVIMRHQPGGVSESGRRCLAIHMLGNGVPRAMAAYVAHYIANSQINFASGRGLVHFTQINEEGTR